MITTNNIVPPKHLYKTHMLSTKPWVTSPLRLYKKNNLFGFVGGLEPPSFVEEISRGIHFPAIVGTEGLGSDTGA